MHKTILETVRKSLSALTVSALVLSTFAFSFGASVPVALAAGPVVTTNAATTVTSADATLNGTNGDTDAAGHSFWVSTTTIDTTSSTIPAGVYSTPDLGAVTAGTAFSAALSSVTTAGTPSNMPAITPGTTYYYVAWSNGGGTWSPGAVESFTTVSAPTIASVAPTSGPTTGGTAITITGTQFANGATVTVGGVAATTVVVASNTSITATTPAGTAGAQDVVVTNTDTGTITSAGAFTYVTPVGNPTAPTTIAATGVTSSDATLNGMNGTSAATGHSFWVSTSTFSTATPTIPTGVFSTADLGALAANTASTALLSSATGLPAVTPNTTYYFAAWSFVDGTWMPGAVLSFTTSETPVPTTPVVTAITPNTGSITGGTTVTITGTGLTGATAVKFGGTAATGVVVNNNSSITAISPATSTTGVVDVTVTTPVGTSAISESDQFAYALTGIVTGGPGVLLVTSITPVQTSATSDNTFADGWSYLFNITVPTNEPHLAMKFADWLNGANIIPVAGNIQISSAQAASTTPVILTAANMYSTPALDMIGNLSTSTPGLHVQVLVQVKVPVNSANGSYTTSYGVQTL